MVMPRDPQKAEETRKRMSESAKKRVRTPEFEAKRAEAMARPETRAKLSATRQRKVADPAFRKMISETTKVGMARPDVKERHSQAVRKGLNRPEVKAKRSASMKKVWEETDIRERVSRTMKKVMAEVGTRPEYKQKMSEVMRKCWADPEYREKTLAAMRAGASMVESQENWSKAMSVVHRNKTRSSIEVIVAALLDSLEVEYEQEKRIGRYIADFYVPSKNLVIECDGEYWHGERRPGAKERDARKDTYLISQGYCILRLPEIEIKNNSFSLLLNTLL